MIKPLIIIALLPFSSAVFSEANIPQQDPSKTILLTAPGTITGIVKQPESKGTPAEKFPGEVNPNQAPQGTTAQPAQQYNYPYYNFIQERDFKFPQYGQVEGRSNPWSDSEYYPRLPPALPPTRGYSSNPWDITGRDILEPGANQTPGSGYRYRTPRYSTSPTMPMMPGFGDFNDMLPNYSNGIFRDTNPAAMGPFMNGLMPGLDNNNFDFPFSPFNMF